QHWRPQHHVKSSILQVFRAGTYKILHCGPVPLCPSWTAQPSYICLLHTVGIDGFLVRFLQCKPSCERCGWMNFHGPRMNFSMLEK
uniref:Uncharacterized protein n=1 Tax=Gasterosteus aculeatus TaxID=69293 RepID=G3N9M4_GASAC